MVNLARIVDRLNSDNSTGVKIVTGVDDICLPCPHIKAGECSRASEDINSADSRVMDKLGLKAGDTLTWQSLLDTVGGTVKPADLRGLCGECRWYSLDYCSDGLTALAGIEPAELNSNGMKGQSE